MGGATEVACAMLKRLARYMTGTCDAFVWMPEPKYGGSADVAG